MSRGRLFRRIAIAVAAIVIAAVIAAILVVQSQWFYNRIRTEIIAAAEKATGGRVEIGAFRFEWKQLRAELRDVAFHGTEPAGKPPLLRADAVVADLKIVSLIKKDIDVQSIDVSHPQVYLMVAPDGSTNIPKPKVSNPNGPNAIESVLRVAARRFDIENGIFEVDAHGSTPFDARGQNLNIKLSYDFNGPRYRGNVSIQPLDVRWGDYAPTLVNVNVAVALEGNRLEISGGKLATGDSTIGVSGAIEDLAGSAHGSFQYDAHLALADAARFLRVQLTDRGRADVRGRIEWPGGSQFAVTGNMNAYGMEYRGPYVAMRGFRADGVLTADPQAIHLSNLRLSGSVGGPGACRGPARAWPCPMAVSGQISKASLRGSDLDFRGVALAVLGGSFQGDASLKRFAAFSVEGDISGIDARTAVAMYSSQAPPWDGMVSGRVQLDGLLQRKGELRASVNLNISPAPQGPPVHGEIAANYDTRTGVLDFGHSTLSLPSSRAEISGALGTQLRVHLETRDLNDLLPALGENASSLPVQLSSHGNAQFEGVVNGKLDNPQISGEVKAANFVWSGRTFDSVQAEITASPDSLHARNASLAMNGSRAQFQLDAALHNWKADSSSQIFGQGSLKDADVAMLAKLLDANLPISGTAHVTGQLSGTVGKPIVSGEVEVLRGALGDEPFDRFSGRVSYTPRTLQLSSAEVTAGAKQVQVSASFDHAADRFDTGNLRFQVSTNAMPLEQVHTLSNQRAGIQGTVQVSATGSAALNPSDPNGFRLTALQSRVNARGLQLTGQPLGDATLTADSQGEVIRLHLASDFADSSIRGDGEWRLAGDYPGSATITFPKLDLADLRAWLAPKPGAPDAFEGTAQGELRVSGPALKPQQMTAELTVSQFQIGPPKGALPEGLALTLQNNGPIVMRMANSVITVVSARLGGRATDLSMTGKVNLNQKNPLDLRVNGRIDLGILHDWNPDFRAAGTVATDASVRGTMSSPQVGGSMSFQNATFNIADLPNGLSNANGTITFTGDRATIQSFRAETGGGTVTLAGSAVYGSGPLVFRLHSNARQVRVRYPEGVSTVADASLTLSGTTDRSMLSGTITIQRSGFNPQSDLGSMLAKSAQPVRTPSARQGLLGGMSFDIQVATAPDVQFESTLTQDIQLDAHLQLRGTASNPALLGRINVTQGQLVFFGTKFTINQGSVSFSNPIRIDPILNVDLETKARGIDVTLTVSGPIDKLNLTTRSDPPLQSDEIVALLASGQAPTYSPTSPAVETTTPQAWQQIGASALLGQAISSPVSGRLQRFFGVSRIRIDPTLPGVQYNPQARLTLEQQVTPEITFTYITNVTTSNPQIVSVEWDLSKQWSAVAVREENGLFGLDFFYKKQFK